jgi:tetratricopeptide (TPR) repeat protein
VKQLQEMGDGRSAAAAYDVMVQRVHGTWPADLRQAASVFFRLKVEDDLIVATLQALAGALGNEEVWAALAARLRAGGRVKCAEVVYDAALRRFPASAKLWGNSGVLYRNQGRFRDAELALKRAIELRPDYKIALHNLASTYELSRQFDAAIPLFERVLQLDAAFAPAWSGLGTCCQLRDPERAKQYYRRAIDLDPDYAVARFNLALLQASQKEIVQAEDTIARFLKKWPEDEGAQALQKSLRAGESIDLSVMQEPDDVFRYAFRLPKNIDWSSPHPAEKGISTSVQLIAPFPDQDRFALQHLDTRAWPDPGPLQPKIERLLFKPQALLGDAPNSSLGFFLSNEMRRHVAEHLGHPPPTVPRLFLSYQRDPALAKWMSDLQSELIERGYDVILDEAVSSGNTVPYVVSLVAKCNVFCPVLTDGYFERIDPGDTQWGGLDYLDDGWAFDEFQLAMAMASAKRAIVVGLWRSGVLLPPFKVHNVLDVREDSHLSQALDRVFRKKRR